MTLAIVFIVIILTEERIAQAQIRVSDLNICILKQAFS